MKQHKAQHKQASNGENNPDPKKSERCAYELYLEGGSDAATTLRIGYERNTS